MRVSVKARIRKRVEWFVNQMRVCVDGTQTCTAPYANGSHTVHCETKFVVFLRKHKENWMHWVSFPCAGCPFHAPVVLCSPQVRKKLITRAPLTRHMGTVQRISGALMYTKLKLLANVAISVLLYGAPI